ncbi:MAG: RIP metalloprotease RseP [Chromatiales bacterium]|nr:RIP metalloprotease RseP [Chromatiales bacterium]
MFDLVETVLWFVVAIGVLVAVHEFGHFIVARTLGVKVLRFSIGFGRALVSWRGRRDGTEYCIAAVPLGGYVKMLDSTEDEDVPEADLPRAFDRQPLGTRFAVVAAGPVFNFLFAIVAYAAMFATGVEGLRPIVGTVAESSPAAIAGLHPGDEVARVGGRDVQTWQGVIEGVLAASLDRGRLELEVQGDGARRVVSLDLRDVALDDLTQMGFFERLGMRPDLPRAPPVVGDVAADSPAQAAGLRTGDRVIAIDGAPLTSPDDLVAKVRASPERALEVRVRRDAALLDLSVTPRRVDGEDGPYGQIGAGVRADADAVAHYYAEERYGLVESVAKGAEKMVDMTLLTVRMLWKMVTLEVSVKNLSGPISIAQYAGASADVGLARFLDFLAVVSISLGLLNLMPIPLLDGGHLMYYSIELFTRRPVSEQVQFVGQRLGIAMLVCLMGLAFYNDLARIFG